MVKEWVEATGSTVDIAVQAALQELGLDSREQAIVEIIKEGKPGILGSSWRAEDAVVKVMAKPPERKRRRRRGRGGKQRENGEARENTQRNDRNKPDRERRVSGEKGGSGSRQRDGAQEGGDTRPQRPPRKADDATRRGGSEGRDRGGAARTGGSEGAAREEEASIEEQAKVAEDFVKGLLGAFGLEGEVTTTIDDDILKIEVTGDQTEALVGRKGVIMQSVLEITRTVVQRKTFGAPRMRMDINGYAERRREALKIYATRQAERVLEEGGEVMLEPMNAADRKVVHDAVAEIPGVGSYSEGEDPDRAVVISKDDADTSG
jgi:spoIIIJ-associated protein